MEQRRLGNSGLKVSLLGLGCNDFGLRMDLEASRRVVHAALDIGVTLIDTADIYGKRGGSETYIGEILGSRRKDVVLATKFGKPMNDERTLIGGSRRYIMRAVEDSLRRLRTDWIDLHQMHELDEGTPIEETLRALDDLVTAGKVRYIGCSNFTAWRMVEAQHVARAAGTNAFICCQDRYNLLAREHEADLFPAMRAYGLSLLPFFPLASGMLTGKYTGGALPEGSRLTLTRDARFLNEANLRRVGELSAFAQERGHNLTELALSWLAENPLVASIIAGASKPEQLSTNLAALGWRLSAEDHAEVDRISR